MYPSERDGILFLSPGAETENCVRTELVSIAYESDENRRLVVGTLAETLDDESVFSETRLFAAEVLGELKAVEALDVLVENIDVRGLLTISINVYPVLNVVIDIGYPAIPYLERGLYHNRETVRGIAAIGLGWIGGPIARQSLERVLRLEANPKVRLFIAGALFEIDRESDQR
jgi:HEAT repeat protein